MAVIQNGTDYVVWVWHKPFETAVEARDCAERLAATWEPKEGEGT